MARNYFSRSQGGDAMDIINAGQQGWEDADNRFKSTMATFATAKAGRQYADGDRRGAARTFAGSGMIDEARVLEGDQVAADTRRAEAEKAAKAERAQTTAAVFGKLRGVEPGKRAATLQRAKPIFDAMNIDTTSFMSMPEEEFTDEALDLIVGQAQEELDIVRGSGGGWQAVGKRSGRVVSSGLVPQPERYEQFDPEKNVTRIPGTAGAGFDAHIGPLLQREGGFVAKDGRSGAPANFGINQRANPDVDVRNLTPERAAQLYKERYWDAAGVDNVPPEAQAAVFDAAVNQGPQRAAQWWAQSGGDLQKFNNLRLQHYRSLPDYGTNGRSWERRVAETGGGGGGPQIVQRAQPKPEGRMATAADKARLGLPADGSYWIEPDGKPARVSEGASEKAPTDGAKQTVAFAYRTMQANSRLTSLADRGVFKPQTPTAQLFDRDRNGVVRIVTKSPTDRQFLQAAKEWLTPVLRRDTGAAVTDEELASYMDIFIPKFEDDQATLRQKAEARLDTMRALVDQEGALYRQRYGEPRFSSKYPQAPKAGPVQGGTGKRPPGVTAAEWSAMTPQERALFK